MSIFSQPNLLRNLLLLDAVTCVAMGSALTFGSGPIAGLTAIPPDLLFFAGLSLFPIAAFMGVSALQAQNWPWAVWLVIGGNLLWTTASFLLLLGGLIAPNPLGYVFVTAQALAVAALAALEHGAFARRAGAFA